ncbi:MAG: hypothetical protein QM638_21865 [Nocardioides sp.]|uniref:maltokinase N-terminal cap-like domain-containing protein n=1 Tax=Nocardioides sp. TaxID=35761 RepID=UPI0039E3DAC9
MSKVHQATLTPGKTELVSGWLGRQAWAAAVGELSPIGSYRFDDPAGRVGVECLLVAGTGLTEGQVLHLPLTYRGSPLEGAEDFLVGTTEHSVLGTRWVYDGCVDPVAVRVLLAAALTGAEQEPMIIHRDGEPIGERELTVFARGSGSWRADETPLFDGVAIRRDDSVAIVEAGGFQLTIAKLVGADTVPVAGDETLYVTWPHGQGSLVGVRKL